MLEESFATAGSPDPAANAQAGQTRQVSPPHPSADVMVLLHQTVTALTAAMTARCRWTGIHQNKVSQLAEAIGRDMGLQEDQLVGLRLAAQAHDIGKFGIPAAIITKPGRLTEGEYGLVKEHAKAGYDILRHVSFPWPIAQIVLQHHERVDGSGYPAGLCGDDILLEARVLAVADVVEAMLDDRPYRRAKEQADVLKAIQKESGSLFDKTIVSSAVRLFTAGGFRFA